MELVLRAVADPSVRWVVRERAEVGRLREVDIPLHDPSISKLHAVLERIEDRYVVQDVGSKNGTRVNGVPVQGSQELAVGDRLQFGSVELLVDAVAEAGDRAGGGSAALLLKLCQSLLLSPDLGDDLP